MTIIIPKILFPKKNKTTQHKNLSHHITHKNIELEQNTPKTPIFSASATTDPALTILRHGQL